MLYCIILGIIDTQKQNLENYIEIIHKKNSEYIIGNSLIDVMKLMVGKKPAKMNYQLGRNG